MSKNDYCAKHDQVFYGLCPKCAAEAALVKPDRHDGHYTEMVIEPMHYCLANGFGPEKQTVIKYTSRYDPEKKHEERCGIRDLEAARDFLNDWIEYEKTGEWKGKSICNSTTTP